MNRIDVIRIPPMGFLGIDQIETITTSAWPKPASVEEFREVFETDRVFQDFFATSQGSQQKANEEWLRDLAEVVNQKMAKAPNAMTGCELMFRFRKTYGEVHHMAQAGVWRDEDGQLQAGFVHQESFAREKNLYRGRVFNTFDTRSAMNGKNPPVLNSLLNQGLPDVLVLPCLAPQRVGLASWLSDERCEHPYGFDGREDELGFHALTCFSITHMVHRAVHCHEVGIDSRATVPHGFGQAMRAYFGETAFERYRYFTYKGQRFDVENLPDKDLVKGFLHLGTTWGNHEPWDVQQRPVVKLRPRF